MGGADLVRVPGGAQWCSGGGWFCILSPRVICFHMQRPLSLLPLTTVGRGFCVSLKLAVAVLPAYTPASERSSAVSHFAEEETEKA